MEGVCNDHKGGRRPNAGYYGWPRHRKNLFQVHGADAQGRVLLKRKLARGKVLEFFATLPAAWSVWRPAARPLLGS